MNFQLLIVIAVIASSLLTLSQRANAQEINKQRWLEPNIEQLCCDNVTPDQDLDSIDETHFVLSSNVSLQLEHEDTHLIPSLNRQVSLFPFERTHPRAPPSFLI